MPHPSFHVVFSADPSVKTCVQAVAGWLLSNSASVSVLREASLSLDLVLMPGMENLTSALRTSGVRLCVSISHSSGLGARMSDCFLCCSFKTWLRPILFSLFLVKSWRRLCSGWSGIFFHLFSVCEKLSVPSRVKELHFSCFLHGSYGCALHCAKYSSEDHVLYLVEFVRVGLGCCSPRTCSVFKRWSHCPSVPCL